MTDEIKIHKVEPFERGGGLQDQAWMTREEFEEKFGKPRDVEIGKIERFRFVTGYGGYGCREDIKEQLSYYVQAYENRNAWLHIPDELADQFEASARVGRYIKEGIV